LVNTSKKDGAASIKEEAGYARKQHRISEIPTERGSKN